MKLTDQEYQDVLALGKHRIDREKLADQEYSGLVVFWCFVGCFICLALASIFIN